MRTGDSFNRVIRSARRRPRFSALAWRPAILALLLTMMGVLSDDSLTSVYASHSGGMDAMSIDVNTSGNTATSLGSLQSCARINENNIQDADETAVDTLTIDVIATNIPVSNPMVAFQYFIDYPESQLTIQSDTHSFLLAANASSSLIDVSNATPDTNGDDTWLGAVGDINSPSPSPGETGSGVLSRLTISTDASAATGPWTLSLRPDSFEDAGDGSNHVDDALLAQSPDLLNNATIAVNSPCGASYIVDTMSDANVTACTLLDDDCSLRGAINNANASGAADLIAFSAAAGDFPVTASATIALGSTLPALTGASADIIDASTAGVIIDGGGGAFPCIKILGDGKSIWGFDGITGCQTGIEIAGSNNVIGDYSDPEGVCSGATDEDTDGFINDGCPQSGTNREMGADCANAADDDLADLDGLVNDGCPARGGENVIRSNTTNGILITGESADWNTIQGNFIGTDRNGAAAASNTNGVSVVGGAKNNTIGGSVSGAGNVISGNTQEGVIISGSNSNAVRGNFIGTNAVGTGDVGNTASGVFITGASSGNTIGGTTAAERNVISGNDGWAGVTIAGVDADNNTVSGNYLGTNAAGTGDLGNAGRGVSIESGNGNVVGGSTAAARNIISGNDYAGVNIFNSASGNFIRRNYIGTNAAGTSAVANSSYGIVIDGSGNNNTVGGTAAGEGNVISGNGTSGVIVSGSGTTGNAILGNYIGTDAAGTADLGNADDGVLITSSASGNTVGGTASGARNVISGNLTGVEITSAATGNLVQANYIGLNAAGTAGLANSNAGVLIQGSATGNTIGGSSASARNVISGNTNNGVVIHLTGTAGNSVKGNYIGTDAAGTGAVANGQQGVHITGGASNNAIGGVAAGEGNLIAFNTKNGVCIEDSGSVGDSVRGNAIHSNGLRGIDLVSGAAICETAAVTPNDALDPDSGPNDLQNFPDSISATFDGSNTTITGALDTASPSTAVVDVYASDVVDVGSGNGEGRAYVGSDVPDGSGAWSLTIPGLPPFTRITATATKGGSTSEFSAVYIMSGPPGAGLPSTAIAFKGQTSPIGSSYNFFGPGQVPNTTGEVVFWSSLLSGTQGIFRWFDDGINPPTTTKYVATGDVAPGGGSFTDLTDAPVVNADGDLAFWAATSAPTQGIYLRASGGSITKLVGVGDAAPGGSTFLSFDPPSGKGIAVINNLGDVSFWASLLSGGQGIYLRKSDGTLLKVAATGDATPAGGTFSTFLSATNFATIPVVTENQEVAFRGFITPGPLSNQGVFLYSQGAGLTKIAATGDASPAGGAYSAFGRIPSPTDGGEVAFWASLSGSPRPNCASAAAPCGVFIWSSGVSALAFGSGDAASPQTGGLISDLSTAPHINDAGQVSVWAGISGGLASQGIVRYTEGYLENVAAIGNSSAIGGTFSDFIDPSGFATNPLLNNQGRVVYWGDVAGGSGSEGVFITDAASGSSSTVVGPVAGEPAPGTNGGTFGTDFDLDINSTGAAVFANTVAGGSASSGIFLFFAGRPVEDVALQGQAAPGDGTFAAFDSPVNNDNGQIAAKATTSDPPSEGLYLFFAGTSAQMAATGYSAPGGGGTYLFFAGSPTINNVGQVASVSTLSGGSSGLYLFFAGSALSGVPCQNIGGYQQCLLGLASGVAPGGDTYLFFAGSPSINDSGRVAQRATLTSPAGEGLYLFFAGSAPSGATCELVSGIRQCMLASTGDGAPGGGSFSSFGNPAINSNGQVVASATVSGGDSGLFLFFAGQPTTRLASAGAGHPFSSFSDATINDSGVVVARAIRADGKEGLFLFFAGNPAVKVALQDDPAATGIGTYGLPSPVFPYMAMNNGSQVVFVANIVGGSTTQGVFIASMDSDSDGVLDFLDNCPTAVNTDQNNTDKALSVAGWNVVADEQGNACDTDDDGDGQLDTAEPSISCRLLPDCDYDGQPDIREGTCGSNPTSAGSVPERIDGAFAGIDDDGDTFFDEGLPPAAANYDCDGDGYKGSAETAIFAPSTQGDQDPCGTNGWPSDFISGGIFESTNRVNIADLNSFLAPRRLDTNPGDLNFNARWDLSPGSGIFSTWINIGDLNALLGGTSGFPPMLGGTRAFSGMDCPWPA